MLFRSRPRRRGGRGVGPTQPGADGPQAGARRPACRVADSLPTTVVALVPADMAKQLGEACKERFNEACQRVTEAARSQMIKAGWVKASNKTFASVWERQMHDVWRLTWTAVAWAEDSSGAGTLLPKTEVTQHEKWARVHAVDRKSVV